MEKMNIMDLINLTILARKGIGTISEGLDPDSAKVAWSAISNAEAVINDYKQKNQQDNPSHKTENVEDTNVEVVTLNENDSVEKDDK